MNTKGCSPEKLVAFLEREEYEFRIYQLQCAEKSVFNYVDPVMWQPFGDALEVVRGAPENHYVTIAVLHANALPEEFHDCDRPGINDTCKRCFIVDPQYSDYGYVVHVSDTDEFVRSLSRYVAAAVYLNGRNVTRRYELLTHIPPGKQPVK
jgi:hypothetical protein